jgi:hypothetical protein
MRYLVGMEILSEYVAALLAAWWWVVGVFLFGLIGVFLDIAELRKRGRLRVLLLLVLIAIVPAQFMAWNDIRKERDELVLGQGSELAELLRRHIFDGEELLKVLHEIESRGPAYDFGTDAMTVEWEDRVLRDLTYHRRAWANEFSPGDDISFLPDDKRNHVESKLEILNSMLDRILAGDIQEVQTE